MAQTTTLHLLTGDYPDRLNAAYAAARAAENAKVELLAGDEHPYDVLKAEYNELKAEAEREATVVTLQAVGRKGWRALKGNHPARTEGDPDVVKGDRLAGLNTQSVEDDLVHASLAAPEGKHCAGDQRQQNIGCSEDNPCGNRAAFTEWADTLSEGEFQTILQKAWSLANVAQYDPKSLPASPTQTSGGNTP